MTVPRQHVEEIPDGDGGTVEVKLGLWISNTNSRRAKLAGEQLDQFVRSGSTGAETGRAQRPPRRAPGRPCPPVPVVSEEQRPA
ncbi:hypothetical protein GCM10010502_65650 [Kitasatospora aureofaciens]|uniref:Helicase-associated domain-containing protein n=1 Tax=Kitasatospora aureofaciens TaxID=1894 RepID=A0A8H9I0V2_KITAU|nr:hypothetical protein GCM10010502_65650 [Kitasatospora aureofaciens]